MSDTRVCVCVCIEVFKSTVVHVPATRLSHEQLYSEWKKLTDIF